MQTSRKTGIFIWFGYRIPIPERVRIIRETGFETILHWWDDSFLELEKFTKEEQVDIIRKESLHIENAHLQFDKANSLWLDTLNGKEALEGYLADIDGLADCEIPVAVLHPTSGVNPPPVSDIGIYRMRVLVERAEKRGVRIALENVSNTHILMYILDSVESSMLGLCYDSGHDYIWSPEPYELLGKYRDRLFAVHLHDNMGEKDDHLPLGQGNVNWDTVKSGIQNSTYSGSYTLESDPPEVTESLSAQEHLSIHFNSAISVLQ